jgi:hypothetical protein
VLLVSLALGLRHASDPDHLAAVTTLIASEEDGRGTKKAGSMGLSWGLGHGTSLILLGLPLVLLGRYLPEPVQQAAESLIGVIIILLGVRLIVRWRRGTSTPTPTTTSANRLTATFTLTNPTLRMSILTTSPSARRSLPMVSGWCMASEGRVGSRCSYSRLSQTRLRRPGRS